MPENVRRIAGKATFTTVTSSSAMNTASVEISSTFHSWLSRLVRAALRVGAAASGRQ